jgi:hypothetical protein
VQSYDKPELWRAYREAFKEFALRVEELESLKTIVNADRISVNRALLEVKRAHALYRQSRDTLASLLLSRKSSGLAEVQRYTPPLDENPHVRELCSVAAGS